MLAHEAASLFLPAAYYYYFMVVIREEGDWIIIIFYDVSLVVIFIFLWFLVMLLWQWGRLISKGCKDVLPINYVQTNKKCNFCYPLYYRRPLSKSLNTNLDDVIQAYHSDCDRCFWSTFIGIQMPKMYQSLERKQWVEFIYCSPPNFPLTTYMMLV